MSVSSDSAEEIVRISLDGFEVVARLSGSMAKEMAVLLYAMAKENKSKAKGQTRLSKLLKSNSTLKIFALKKEDFKDFKKQAKKYNVLYSALYQKEDNDKDGIIDILVKEEDAVRVNRIIERFELTTVEKVENEIKETENKKPKETSGEQNNSQKEIYEKNTSQDFLNKLLNKQATNEINENNSPSNLRDTEKEIQSENLLKTNERKEEIKEEKPSIREQIEHIKQENKEKEKLKNKEEIITNVTKQTNVKIIKNERSK